MVTDPPNKVPLVDEFNVDPKEGVLTLTLGTWKAGLAVVVGMNAFGALVVEVMGEAVATGLLNKPDPRVLVVVEADVDPNVNWR